MRKLESHVYNLGDITMAFVYNSLMVAFVILIKIINRRLNSLENFGLIGGDAALEKDHTPFL